ncbi:hypothetical protein ACJZ2D_006555 [Fusarium nematophilum]
MEKEKEKPSWNPFKRFGRKDKKSHASSASSEGDNKISTGSQGSIPAPGPAAASSSGVEHLVIPPGEGAQSTKKVTSGPEPAETNSQPPEASPEAPPQSIWTDAYADLKAKDGDLVDRYDRILKTLVQDASSTKMAAPEPPSKDDKPEQMQLMEKAIKVGLERTEKEAKAKGRVGELNRLIGPVRSVIERAVKPSPEAALVWTCFSFGLEILMNPVTEHAAQRDGMEHVTSRMDWYRHLSESVLAESVVSPELREALQKTLTSLYKDLLSFLMKSICLYHQNRVLITLRDFLKYDDWERQVKSIKDKEDAVSLDIKQYSAQEITKSIKNVVKELQKGRAKQEDEESRETLRKTVPFYTKASILTEKGKLVPDCCTWLFHSDEFRWWRDEPERRVLWISGAAGKGKTMLLCAMTEWFEHSRGLSYFFCRETNSKLNSEAALLRGLIYSITGKVPDLMKHVKENLDGLRLEDRDGGTEALCTTLRSILTDPLASDAIILIDALDECTQSDPGEPRELVLDLIADLAGKCKAKWVISSRNNLYAVEGYLGKTPGFLHLRLEDPEHPVSDAVEQYVNGKVNDLWEARGLDSKKKKEVKDGLILGAEKTFLWVSLVWSDVTRVLKTKKQPDDVDFIMGRIEAMPKGLNPLYEKMMAQLICDEDPEHVKDILRIVYLARRPLAIQELWSFVGKQHLLRRTRDLELLKELIHQASSFITIQNDIVMFVHKSAKDYIKSDKTVADLLLSDIGGTHRKMFQQSVANMSILEKDIYDVEHAGTARNELKRPDPDPLTPIAYSCVHWVDHLTDSDCSSAPDVQESIQNFLSDHLLYWLEALGWLGELSAGIEQLDTLLSLVSGDSGNVVLVNWINDARRILLKFRPAVEERPLQIYTSALVFAPSNSLVKQTRRSRRDAPTWVTHVYGIEQDWNPCSVTMERPRHCFDDIFWHNSQGLTTTSSYPDKAEIVHWSAKTGSRLREVQIPDASELEAEIQVVASKNGQKFAWFGRHTCLVYVWDATTGDLETFEFVPESEDQVVLSIALSNTGQYIVAGCGLYYRQPVLLKIWATAGSRENARQPAWQRPVRCSQGIGRVAFLTDDIIASVSGDSIQIVDSDDSQRHRLQAVDRVGDFLACSESGSRLVASISAGDVQVWDVQTTEYRVFKSCIGALEQAQPCLSGDGSKLAFCRSLRRAGGNPPSTLEIWPLTTNEDCIKLDCGGAIDKLAFSRDGRLLASSIRWHYEIDVWDVTQGTRLMRLRGHQNRLQSLSFSRDSRQLASASADRTAKVWEMTVTASHALDEKRDSLGDRSVGFSLDGQRLCSIEGSGALRVSSNLGLDHQELVKHGSRECTNIRFRPVFSDDGQKLAFSRHSCAIEVWEIGRKPSWLCDLGENNDEVIQSIDFSRTGDLIASGAYERFTIWSLEKPSRVLDVDLRPMGNHQICSVKFLPDDHYLALGTIDGDIMLWDKSGHLRDCRQHKLGGAREPITAMETIATDASERLVSASSWAVRIWDVTDRACMKCICTLDVGTVFQLYQDPGQSSIVYTNRGVLDMDKLTLSAAGSQEKATPYHCRGYGLSYNETWIIEDGKEVMWVPPEYRPAQWGREHDKAVWGSTMAIASGTGKLFVLQFADDKETRL